MGIEERGGALRKRGGAQDGICTGREGKVSLE
jgi:hypothetical protein